MKWKRLRHKQFAWYYGLILLWCLSLPMLALLYMMFRERYIILGIGALFGVGALLIATARLKLSRIMKISKQMENFVRRNNLYQSHYTIEQGILGERKIERMDYYPIIEYRAKPDANIFCIRVRMDGSLRSEKFRDLEQPLADMFRTICTDRIEERGYLTYCFEMTPQEQVKIQSHSDIKPIGTNAISFSRDIVWAWKYCPHLLVTGVTGTGKSLLVQYIISCFLEQGVRVIYCDPKNDDDMRAFMQNQCATYVRNENEIAKAVRETEHELRMREQDLQAIEKEEAEFQPIFLFFDELLAFSKITEKKTYEETMKRLASIVVMGRSKRIYVGLILQRPDTSFVEGAIRDNLGCRICMGQMSEAAYKMVFGSDYADIKNNRREVGSGLIYRQGVDTKPREFLAPFIEKGALNRME